jgi:hypothetical protein
MLSAAAKIDANASPLVSNTTPSSAGPNASIYTGVTVPTAQDETPSATYTINTSVGMTGLMR